jgi:hypothetical protein
MNTTNENDAVFQATFAPAVYGTNDWTQVTGYISVPQRTVRMDLVGLGGWQMNLNGPANTWFDSIAISKGSFRLVTLNPATPVPSTVIGSSVDASKYTALVNIRTLSTLIFAESFDPRWTATIVETGEPLVHIPAYGWANGFIVDHPGNWTIQLALNSQSDRNVSLALWTMVWSALLIIPTIMFLADRGVITRMRRALAVSFQKISRSVLDVVKSPRQSS